jgi:hypothetical protein
MAATVNIVSKHGSTGTTTSNVDGGTVYFRTDDTDTNDASAPISVPAAGTNYSYIKNFRFAAATTPSNTINNLKVYTDGANGMGTGLSVNVKTSASYVDPTAQTTTQLTSTTDLFTYTSGSPLAVTGSISNPSTGQFGDHVVMQMGVASTAGPGLSAAESVTFSYDES